MQVTAAVMEEKSGPFKLDTVELGSPQPDEVLVKIHCDRHLPHRPARPRRPFPDALSRRIRP